MLIEVGWAWIKGSDGTKLAGSANVTTGRTSTGVYTATLTDENVADIALATHFTQSVSIPEGIQAILTSPRVVTINVLNRVNGVSDADHLVRLYRSTEPTPASQTVDGTLSAADKTTIDQAIAGWSTSLKRSFIVDDAAGDDTRSGFIDAAPGTDLSGLAAAVSIKTLARLSAIVPRNGNGRTAEVIIKSATYSGGIFGGWYGYDSLIVRGTSTDATAGTTAFKCDAADYTALGGVRAAGTNAAGYNVAYSTKTIQLITPGTPIAVQCNTHGFATGDKVYLPDATALPEARGYFTITVVDSNNFTLDSTTSTNGAIGSTFGAAYRWKVTLAGGGAPGFTDDNTSTALNHLRLRGDAATTTAGLRNFCTTIIANGVDTIVPAADLTTPVGSDVFYLEEPGAVVPVINLLGGRRGTGPSTSATLLDVELAGLKTGTLTAQDTGFSAAFVHATSSVSILRCGNVALQNVYTDLAGNVRTPGGCRLAAGNNLNDIAKLSLAETGFLGATLFFNIKDTGGGNISAPGCLWAGGLNVRGCTPDATGQQTGVILGCFPNGGGTKMIRFKGANGTLQAVLVSMSGVAIFEAQVSDCTNGLEIAGQGTVVDLIGLCGSRAISNFGICFGGPVWSYDNSLLLRNINRFSGVFGTNGAIAMGSTIDPLTNNPAGPTFLDFANFLVANVVDGNGNRIAPVSSNGLNFNGSHMLSCQNWPAAAALSAYRVVRVDASSKAALAQADTAANAAGVLGFTVGPAGASGVTSSVLVTEDDGWVQMDLSNGRPAVAIGNKIWLSTDTAGLGQPNEPSAGQQAVFLGYAVQISGIQKARVVRFSPERVTRVAKTTDSLTVPSLTSAVLDAWQLQAVTSTVTGSTAITTAGGFNLATINAPTITDASAVTITSSATLAITGAPIAAGSATITNPYAFWVQGGKTYLAGTLGISEGGFGAYGASNQLIDAAKSIAGSVFVNVRNLTSGTTNDAFFYAETQNASAQCGVQMQNIGSTVFWTMGADGANFRINNGSAIAAQGILSITGVNANVLIGTLTEVATTKFRVDASKTFAQISGSAWDGVDLIASTLTLSNSTNITNATGVNAFVMRAPTITSAGTPAVTAAATLAITGAPAAGGTATITNAYAVWVQGGTTRHDGRVTQAKGADIVAAGTLTLGTDGNTFKITGNTAIDFLTTTGWQAGSIVILVFSGTPTVNHNTGSPPANTAAVKLASSVPMLMAADSVLVLFYDGTVWQEMGRKAA